MILLRVITVSLLLAAGQVFLKVALSTAPRSAGLTPIFRALFWTWAGWLALACTCAAALLWLRVLVTADLGVAYPLISLSYVFVLLLAMLCLKETVSVPQLLGVMLILAGVALVVYRG